MSEKERSEQRQEEAKIVQVIIKLNPAWINMPLEHFNALSLLWKMILQEKIQEGLENSGWVKEVKDAWRNQSHS